MDILPPNLMLLLRELILDAAPDMVEEWKWETPVFAHNGNVVAIGAFKNHSNSISSKARRSTIRTASSTPDWRPKQRAPSTFTKVTPSTNPPYRSSCVRPWRSTALRKRQQKNRPTGFDHVHTITMAAER